ncbi:MAG: S8 family serine peptidase [Pseudomonadota bacterium]
MTDRPILRLPSGRAAPRLPGHRPHIRNPGAVGRQAQAARFRDQFERLEEALEGDDATVVLRQDPAGIAPERALVFVTAVPIQNFIRAAEAIGLEVFSEFDLDDYDLDDDLLDRDPDLANPTLYATMPSEDVLNRIRRLWKAYHRNEAAEHGDGPWWNLFDMLAELRPWGPEDRLNERSRQELSNRLPMDDDQDVRLELEIWPTKNPDARRRWRRDTEARVNALGGRIVSQSSIAEAGFVYEALLIAMSAASVRTMLENPFAPSGLALLDGLQFILPKTVAQSLPAQSDPDEQEDGLPLAPFDVGLPMRAVLMDGTPMAAHPYLDGGLVIEDVHGLVPNSVVSDRLHATAMASLILRGDLRADGSPIEDSRLLSIPVLVDVNQDTRSPEDRLFVDVVHVALTRAFLGEDPLAPDAFVVNFSIGIRGAHFSGLISSLARLMDWWADAHGVLFIVSAGNVVDDLTLSEINSIEFEECDPDERATHVEAAKRLTRHQRTLLAPSEALNVITVGAASLDFAPADGPAPASEVSIERGDGIMPAISSAIGLGPFRSVKPDFLHIGGEHNVRMTPSAGDLNLRLVWRSRRTGLFVASAGQGARAFARSRGTSCANALTTRAHLRSAAALTQENGPYAGQELPRRDLALLTRALSVNSARWPQSAHNLYGRERARNPRRHLQAKQEVARYFGHGVLNEDLMRESPGTGATIVGRGTLRKDQAVIFDLPLPPSLSGQRLGRSMHITLAWFSPVEPARAVYRLAALEAVASNYDAEDRENDPKDSGWNLDLKSGHLDEKMIKRGTVWSKRMVQNRAHVPVFEDGEVLPIRVQCRDASNGGLDPNEDIRFAIAVTLDVDAQLLFDIHSEIEDQLRIRLQGAG